MDSVPSNRPAKASNYSKKPNDRKNRPPTRNSSKIYLNKRIENLKIVKQSFASKSQFFLLFDAKLGFTIFRFFLSIKKL